MKRTMLMTALVSLLTLSGLSSYAADKDDEAPAAPAPPYGYEPAMMWGGGLWRPNGSRIRRPHDGPGMHYGPMYHPGYGQMTEEERQRWLEHHRQMHQYGPGMMYGPGAGYSR